MSTTSRDQQLQALGVLVDVPMADELGRMFAASGHELHLVGGSVRDILMGQRSPDDLDFATSASPEESEALLRPWADDLWLTGARFGTVSAAKDGVIIEITTFRHEAYTPGSRHPEVRYGDSIEGDLARRDFTVNAIAVRVPDRVVFDPFGGWEDLARKVLKTPIDPAVSYADDPLRMLRLARFTATLGFHADAASVEAVEANPEALDDVAAERIRTEFDKLVCGPHVAAGLKLLVKTGLAERFIPEIPALAMQRDPAHHHKDVFAHTLAVVEGCDRSDLTLRLAALFHDIGKPSTREFHPDGTVSFHNHDVVGARMTRHRMRELHYPKEMIRNVSELVRLHLRFHGYSNDEWSDSAVRRYVNDAGDRVGLERLNALTRADVTTANKRKKQRFAAAMDDLEERIERLEQEEAIRAVRPELDGNEIMRYLDIEPGPLVGKAWARLKELRLDLGPVEPDRAYDELDEFAAEHGLTTTSRK